MLGLFSMNDPTSSLIIWTPARFGLMFAATLPALLPMTIAVYKPNWANRIKVVVIALLAISFGIDCVILEAGLGPSVFAIATGCAVAAITLSGRLFR